MRTLLVVAAAALALAGCESFRRERVEPAAPPPEVIAPPPVLVEVQPPAAPAAAPKPCVPRTLSPPPRYPDTDQALRGAAGAADRYQLLAAGRLLRQRRLDELERVIAGCR